MDDWIAGDEQNPVRSVRTFNMDMQNIDLDKEARHGLTERAGARMCSVGGVGTGNVLKIDDRLLIVTCRHVSDFYLQQ